jgi:predicted nucleic-acid-binding protein
MKALDTNVLVRFLLKDDERQAEAVYRIFKQAELNSNVFFVSTPVLLETIWVLDSVYEIARREILDAIDELLLMPILEFDAQSAIRSFISSGRENKADLSDFLIAHYAKYSGCDSVLTFDKKASKIDLFELLN